MPGSEADRVRDLPHTADIGFEVDASSLPRLFELAADGLTRALGARPGADRPPRRERLSLARPDLDRLLVAWLRELLHRATAERLLPQSALVSVRREAGGSFALEADVTWREWVDATAPSREIKGVTYHGLRVEERDGAWHARLFLDV